MVTYLLVERRCNALACLPRWLCYGTGVLLLGTSWYLDRPVSFAPHLSLGIGEKLAVLLCFLAMTLCSTPGADRKRATLLAGSCVTVAIAALVLVVGKPLERVRPDFSGYYRDFDATIVAETLSRTTPGDSVLLVPPLRFEFRYFSRRALAFDFMGFPYRKDAMALWRERFTLLSPPSAPENALPGTTPWGDVGSLYTKLSNEQLVAAARTLGAQYIVTRDEWHQAVTAERMLNYNGWSVYAVSAPAAEGGGPSRPDVPPTVSSAGESAP